MYSTIYRFLSEFISMFFRENISSLTNIQCILAADNTQTTLRMTTQSTTHYLQLPSLLRCHCHKDRSLNVDCTVATLCFF